MASDAKLGEIALRATADEFKRLGFAVEPVEPLPADPWTFAQRCCLTIDEATAWDSDQVIRPFPDWPFLRDVIQFMHGERFGRIDKSGQLMVSWAVIAFRLWCVLTKRGFRYAYYCGTQTKAERHVESRFWRMYQSIPTKYAKPYAEHRGGQIIVYHDGPGTLPTSFVIPQAAEQSVIDSAAEKMRSETWTAADLDESPFYKNLEELHNSLLPRTQDLHHIGTPNGHEFFHRLGFGDVHDQRARTLDFHQIGADLVRRGVWNWRRNGFAHLRVHYSAHPDRDPATAKGAAWVAAGKSRSSSRLWAREQEVSYDIEAGLPVFVDTERIIESDQGFQPWQPVIRGFDYSFLCNVGLVSQVKRHEDGRHGLRIIRQIVTTETTIQVFGAKVMAECGSLFPGVKKWLDFGDYSANQRTATGTIIQEMQKLGIVLTTVPTGPGGVLKGCELVQTIISAGLLEVDPSCDLLLQALRNRYTRDDEGEPNQEHPWEDLVDALRYLVVNTFELVTMRDGSHAAGLKEGLYRGYSGRDKDVPTEWAMQTQTNAAGRIDYVRLAGYRGQEQYG